MDASALNRMLEGRVKQLAGTSRGASKEDRRARLTHLQKTLGLFPLPPRTESNAQVTGALEREGFRIEKLRYESRPGLPVSAHLVLPDSAGPWPLLVSAHGPWPGKKAAPVVQARGIAFALRGFATLTVDSPGGKADDPLDERAALGDPADVCLLMGAPALGQYAWDLMRAIDACGARSDLDLKRIGVMGEVQGGVAAALAFALDERIGAAALVCCAPSMEEGDLSFMAGLGLPGLALAGDLADILAIRAPAPVLLAASRADGAATSAQVSKTSEKLNRLGKNVRLELFEGPADFNRRMREVAAAFFGQHLLGMAAAPYLPELRPLTDGVAVPYPAGTLPADDPSLRVFSPGQPAPIRLADVLARNLAEPYPEPIRVEDWLVPWLKFGPAPQLPSGAEVLLVDEGISRERSSCPEIVLPIQRLDWRVAALAGLSVPQFLAQVLHLSLPGKPETWEPRALAGDGLSAMIASVKTLVESSAPAVIPTKVFAEGPVASLTACFLKLLRPSLEVEPSHTWSGWADVAATSSPELIQPLARYLEWPF